MLPVLYVLVTRLLKANGCCQFHREPHRFHSLVGTLFSIELSYLTPSKFWWNAGCNRFFFFTWSWSLLHKSFTRLFTSNVLSFPNNVSLITNTSISINQNTAAPKRSFWPEVSDFYYISILQPLGFLHWRFCTVSTAWYSYFRCVFRLKAGRNSHLPADSWAPVMFYYGCLCLITGMQIH